MSRDPATAPAAVRPKLRWRSIGAIGALLVLGTACGLGYWFFHRYDVSKVMEVPIRDFSTAEYPEDPADRSVHFSQYSGRKLRLVQKDETHFDFLFEPTNTHTATVIFRNVDVGLMTPGEPAWTRGDPNLERIALTDRQWNRQQVRFDPHSPQVEVSGGDGFEKANLDSAELAKNCLNAGLWEVLLFVRENGAEGPLLPGLVYIPHGALSGPVRAEYGRLVLEALVQAGALVRPGRYALAAGNAQENDARAGCAGLVRSERVPHHRRGAGPETEDRRWREYPDVGRLL